MHRVDRSAGSFRVGHRGSCRRAGGGGCHRSETLPTGPRRAADPVSGRISDRAFGPPPPVSSRRQSPCSEGIFAGQGGGRPDRPGMASEGPDELVRRRASAYIRCHSSHRQSPCDSSGGCRPGPRGPAHVDRPGTALSPCAAARPGPRSSRCSAPLPSLSTVDTHTIGGSA